MRFACEEASPLSNLPYPYIIQLAPMQILKLSVISTITTKPCVRVLPSSHLAGAWRSHFPPLPETNPIVIILLSEINCKRVEEGAVHGLPVWDPSHRGKETSSHHKKKRSKSLFRLISSYLQLPCLPTSPLLLLGLPSSLSSSQLLCYRTRIGTKVLRLPYVFLSSIQSPLLNSALFGVFRWVLP